MLLTNILCVSQFTKKLHKIMLNKKMIEKFKQIEKNINNYDIFSFYTFDEFIKIFDNVNDEYKIVIYENIQKLKNKYNCNNDNTIVLLYNVDDDEYLIINFENDTKIITQNVDIEYVNNDVCNNALYDILQCAFMNEYY